MRGMPNVQVWINTFNALFVPKHGEKGIERRQSHFQLNNWFLVASPRRGKLARALQDAPSSAHKEPPFWGKTTLNLQIYTPDNRVFVTSGEFQPPLGT